MMTSGLPSQPRSHLAKYAAMMRDNHVSDQHIHEVGRQFYREHSMIFVRIDSLGGEAKRLAERLGDILYGKRGSI